MWKGVLFSDHTLIVDAFMRGGEDPTTLMDKLIDFLPELAITRGWSINKLGEHATGRSFSRTMVGLFFQVKAVERLYERELETTKQSLARRKAKIWDLEKKVKVVEQKVETTVADYKASSALIVEALALTEQLTGEQMVWKYGKWAFMTGNRKMYTKVREALAKSLDDDDLSLVLDIFLEEIANLGLAPYTEPIPTKEKTFAME
nr:leucine zipper putative tumor suppressor 2-like [Ipomoea batatas]